MSRLVARAETWERVYDAFQNVNFAAFDYNTVKRSVLDYIKLYFPETFNDFIESSELISIVEIFAYIAELMAYRLDVNAHENFITVAQRKDSILRLARLVSYTASRPIPARGLVKITSVSTTESIIDTNGNDLAGRTILWNDTTNAAWKEQFTLVMNRVLDQEFGSVNPNDRFQIQDVLFETYSWDLVPLANGVFPYTSQVNGTSVAMELVPVAYSSALGVIERRPVNNANFTILYGQDGLGDASDTTGFFCYTKQGTLQRFRTTFDGVTPNQVYEINTDNVNDTDIWVNNVDPATGDVLDSTSALPYKKVAGKSGEWVEVDLAHAQNVIFNTNPNRSKYEIETRANNRARILFGDGEFADIPLGTFDIWARSSLDEDILVSQSAVSNTPASFTYVDGFGRTQTFSFTFSLISSLQNASASEDIEHVRQTAPAVYYSQDRMVNGEDYNVFPLQDPSILKLRSINRTFAGDSKYISWHDSSGTYENVKIYGDDGILYFEDREASVTTPVIDLNTLVTTYIQPLLSSSDLFMQLSIAGVTQQQFKRVFTSQELTYLSTALSAPAPVSVDVYYNKVTHTWYPVGATSNLTDPFPAGLSGVGYDVNPSASQFIEQPLLKITQTSALETRYSVARVGKRVIFQSPTTSFWDINDANRIVDYDTLQSTLDAVTILESNLNCNRTTKLKNNWTFNVLGQEINQYGTEIGLRDESRLSVIPQDQNQDGIPDYVSFEDYINMNGAADIIMPKLTVTSTGTLTLPIPYISGRGDIITIDTTGTGAVVGEVGAAGTVQTTLDILSLGTNSSIIVMVRDYVYFTRTTTDQNWVPAPTNLASVRSFLQDEVAGTTLWKREQGRANLMFAWMHSSPRYYLVDPAASNLIDAFVITKGYFTGLKHWLEDPLAEQPALPTPLDLRTTYNYLLANGMISDTTILHPGKVKLLFGHRADPALQARIKVVRSSDRTLTDNQIKTLVVTAIRNFFDITLWEFGEPFFFSELSAAIHTTLPTEISSVVPVPVLSENFFGTLFQVFAAEDEVFYPDISTIDIDIVTSLNATTLHMSGNASTTIAPAPSAQATITYALAPNVTSVNEGGTVVVTLTTTNLPDGTTIPFTISGPGITASDFASNTLKGTFTVVNNTAFASIVIANDMLTEGPETATVTLDNSAAFCSFTITDTSLTPITATYALSSSASSVNEGSTVDIVLTTTGVDAGTVIPATITGITSPDLDNLTTDERASMIINFTVGNDGTATRTMFIRADSITEGPETMTVTLGNNAASVSVIINDTSNAIPPPPPPPPPVLQWSVTPNPVQASAVAGQWSTVQTITVTNSNSSNQSLVLTGVDYTIQSGSSDTSNLPTMPYTLDPGASITFNARFLTNTVGQTTNSSVNVYSSNGGQKNTPLWLTGQAQAPVITSQTLDKGSYLVNSQVVMSYVIQNDTAWDKFGYNDPTVFIATSNGTQRSAQLSAPSTPGTYPLVLRASNGSQTVDSTVYVPVTGYPQVNLTGIQSASACYSAQSGFSVDQYADGSIVLTIGAWPTDPPNCQTCDWTWLSNNAAVNNQRAGANSRPYWTMVGQQSISGMSIGSTVNYLLNFFPYTAAAYPGGPPPYTFAITRTAANSIQIRSYPQAWSTGDTGTTYSIYNWWDMFNRLGGGSLVTENNGFTNTYTFNMGVVTLSW